MATAHPAKFRDIVEPLIGQTVKIPDSLMTFLAGMKQSVMMKAGPQNLEEYLADRYQNG